MAFCRLSQIAATGWLPVGELPCPPPGSHTLVTNLVGSRTGRVPTNFQHHFSMDALLRSHHELRTAVRLAGQKIAKLNFGRRDDPMLVFLRRTLREARILAKAARQQATQG